MGAVLNGLSLSKVRPYGSGFLIFSDYGKAPIRLAAIMEIPVIYVFTHDSIGVGEDGPTHQPVEQLVSLRAIPGLVTLRPADANEVAEAWRVILQLPPRAGGPDPEPAGRCPRSTARSTPPRPAWPRAPTCWPTPPDGKPDVLLMATGSEVAALRGRPRAARRSRGSRAAWSACRPGSCSTTSRQEYRDSVLPPSVTARVSVEQASTLGWERYVGSDGRIIGMNTFGASAPLKELQKKFGFEPEQVVAAAKEILGRKAVMKIVVGSDHAGFALKQEIAACLRADGHDVLDVGTHSTAPADYPDSAEAVGRAVVEGRAERGVLVCGSGVGASVAANKVTGVRAAICHDIYSAHQGVEHDDMNVLVLGGPDRRRRALARGAGAGFVSARFSNEERHVRRLNKVKALEERR